MALSNWWKQRNQFVSVYTQRFKVGFVFMCSQKGWIESGLRRWANGKWFKKGLRR
jgi:hypothetical protein